MSAERLVQVAVYAALTGDGTYMGLVTGVYDGRAPQGTAYPYTVIGSTTEVDAGDISDEGWSLTFTVHDWSDYGGKKECQQIREARDDLLHRKLLTVSGFGQVHIRREFAQVIIDDVDSDNTLHHGISRYRASAWAA